METQSQRLLAYLEKNGSIDPLQAWKDLGIYRLGARVFDLRQAGHSICKTMAKVQNRFGEECRVALYSLVPNEKA